MFESTKYFISFVSKNRLGIIFSALMFFVITLMYQTMSMDPYENSRLSSVKSRSVGSAISESCLVTHHVQTIRERENTIHINPARHVVEELLEIMIFNSNICPIKKEGERLVVTIIDSGRDRFMERQLIRRTWGSLLKYKDWHVRTVFLLGQSDYCLNTTKIHDPEMANFVSKEEQSLVEEYRKYGDIVIGAFTDSYRNLTYKHLMGYKFVQEYCPEADWIVKTDDDMFANLPAILDMRTGELTKNSSQPSDEKPFDIYCHFYHDNPTRCTDCGNGKWFSTREEWPEDTYPLYCLGNDYGISMNWLKRIYSVRGLGGFFWVDDVFIMGKLREIAENTYNDTTNKLNILSKVTDKRWSPYVKDNCNKDEVDFGLFVFLVRSSGDFEMEVECLWKKALRDAKVNAVLVSKNWT